MAKKNQIQIISPPKLLKNIPASEDGPGVRLLTKSGNVYIVSQDTAKQKFTLWHEIENGYEKMAVANSPLDLYDLTE